MRLGPAFLQTARKKSTLRIALLISVIIHGAVLLWVKFEPADTAAVLVMPTIEVTLIPAQPEKEVMSEVVPEPATPEVAPATPQRLHDFPEPSEPTAESPASPNPIDWKEIVSTYSNEAMIRNLEKERLREVMWLKTFSVMFAPPEDWLIEDTPYLPDLEFESDKPRRLGIKIGENCYLGFSGIDPQSVDSDAPGWSGGGSPQPTGSLVKCGFGG